MKSKPWFFIHVLVFVILFKCTTSLSVEAKPAMLNPLRFPPWWQTLRIRDRPTSIILEKCFWDKYHLPFRCRDIFLWAVDHGRSGWKKRCVVMISGRSAPQCRKVRVDRNGIQRKWVKAPSVSIFLCNKGNSCKVLQSFKHTSNDSSACKTLGSALSVKLRKLIWRFGKHDSHIQNPTHFAHPEMPFNVAYEIAWSWGATLFLIHEQHVLNLLARESRQRL